MIYVPPVTSDECELVCLCAQVIGGRQFECFVLPPPRCLFHTSSRNCWIASSIWYATRISRSRIAASSRSNRSHALESISSRTSSSTLPRTGLMESRVFGPLHLSRVLHRNLVDWLPSRHQSYKERKGLLVISFFSRHRLDYKRPQKGPHANGDLLFPFQGFSLVLKSLRIDATALVHSQIFDLIHSFPLLENLSVNALLRSRYPRL